MEGIDADGVGVGLAVGGASATHVAVVADNAQTTITMASLGRARAPIEPAWSFMNMPPRIHGGADHLRLTGSG